MVRAPCCEKMGLKKGPWTPEEDQILTNYIRLHGHGNWRKLPKLAGLLRCGKSCRLRWTNYLRPDIKRGNFSRAEEETIIRLHGMLGNRWSAIAARLPGRTDNEIKNVWHTHLKKRLQKHETNPASKHESIEEAVPISSPSNSPHGENHDPLSPQHCNNSVSETTGDLEDNFWSEVLSADDNYGDINGGFSEIDNFTLWEGTDDYWYNILSKAELPEFLEI